VEFKPVGAGVAAGGGVSEGWLGESPSEVDSKRVGEASAVFGATMDVVGVAVVNKPQAMDADNTATNKNTLEVFILPPDK
jgi:hypothetical protein